MPFICTAERNGEPKGYCTDSEGTPECYASWTNVQQFTCPVLTTRSKLVIDMPPDITPALCHEIAARIFGEKVL